jgi:hypothetical protein
MFSGSIDGDQQVELQFTVFYLILICLKNDNISYDIITNRN